jgi:hypothetical protein
MSWEDVGVVGEGNRRGIVVEERSICGRTKEFVEEV